MFFSLSFLRYEYHVLRYDTNKNSRVFLCDFATVGSFFLAAEIDRSIPFSSLLAATSCVFHGTSLRFSLPILDSSAVDGMGWLDCVWGYWTGLWGLTLFDGRSVAGKGLCTALLYPLEFRGTRLALCSRKLQPKMKSTVAYVCLSLSSATIPQRLWDTGCRCR